MALEAIAENGHFHAALVKFVSAFWGKPRAASLLLAMINRVQDLEDALWPIFEAYHIDTADDTRLDVLGRIVGQRREAAWDTETYRSVLRGKIRANLSRGLETDIIEVIQLVMLLTNEVVQVHHYAPATLAVLPEKEASEAMISALGFLMPKTRSAGVRMHVFHAPEDLGTYDFASTGIDLDDTTDPGSVDPGLFDVRVL
jgi:hypothetical protein